MTCVYCEVTRAKVLAASRALFNTETLEDFANRLTETYNVPYYVSNGSLYRTNQIGEHVPYLIWPLI